MLSFQCEKPYKDNHVVQIQGQFVDSIGTPIPYFEFFITHRDMYATFNDEPNINKKIIRTDEQGSFQVLTAEFQQTRTRIPVLAFVDTTWKFNLEMLYDSVVFGSFTPLFMNNNSEGQLNLGTIEIKQ